MRRRHHRHRPEETEEGGGSRRRRDVLLAHDPCAEEPTGHGVDRRPPRAQDQEAADRRHRHPLLRR